MAEDAVIEQAGTAQDGDRGGSRLRAPRRRRIAATVAALAVAASGLAVSATPAAAEIEWPSLPSHPETVTADALPTVQINGVVWAQLIVGNTVYVGGSFTSARNPGVGPNGASTPRSNFLAYNLSTGQLRTDINLPANGQVRTLEASPDGSRVYVGGDFRTFGGQSRNRIAAISTATNTVVSNFAPNIGYHVWDIDVHGSTVYVGGNFTNVGSQTRQRLAAFNASNGALLPWAPSVPDREVKALVVSPDGTQVAIGGNFETLNGTKDFGRGFAVLDAVTGATMPFAATSIIRNGGVDGGILTLASDGELLYGGGYTFGRPSGTLEGVFAAEWGSGTVRWVNECHGDTYSIHAQGDVIYQAGHSHYCGNIGGWGQPTTSDSTWIFKRGTAMTRAVGGTVARERLGYTNFEGQPHPDLINWFPNLNAGTYTGLNQGPWSITGNDRYVLMGGEFTNVNGSGQQGLVRFQKPEFAANDRGPELAGNNYPARVQSFRSGQATITWAANTDQDDDTLLYRVYRRTGTSGNGTLLHSRTVRAPFWNLPVMTWTDTTAGSTAWQYRVQVTDPDGNVANTPWTGITPVSTTASDYVQAVLASEPDSLWRLGEAPGSTTAADTVGWRPLGPSTGTRPAPVAPTFGQPGAIDDDADGAVMFGGLNSALVSTLFEQPTHIFSIEGWFKAPATANGGLIAGFNNSSSAAGSSSTHDRMVFMDGAGRVSFGVNPSLATLVTADADFRDDQWHHVVATLGSDGMKLYVDGTERAADPAVTHARTGYYGYWRIGGGALNGFPGTSSTTDARFFDGQIDEVAVYRDVLSPTEALAHYEAGYAGPANQPPTAVATVTSDPGTHIVTVTGDGSSDPEGGTLTYSWDFGDGSPAVTGMTASRTYTTAGPKTITLTVTDNAGKTGTAQVPVSVVLPNEPPVAAVSVAPHDGLSIDVSGTGSTDPDGSIVGWSWNFGDQTPVVTTPTASHTYATPGTYTVTLTVTDDSGTTDEESVQVTVTAPPPNQAPVAAITVAPHQGLTIDVSSDDSDDPDGDIVGWSWNFGDDTADVTTASASHTYAAPGTYTVTLTVTDDDGAETAVTTSVTVTEPANQAPTAALVASTDDLVVSVSGAGSADADGTVVGHSWNFGDGTPAVDGATATHTYANPGTYTITLTVTDDDDATGTATTSVTVSAAPPANVAPTAAISVGTPDGLTVQVSGTGSSDIDGDVVHHLWNFGDGTAAVNGATATHTYANPGTYTITLSVTDDDDATGTATTSVTVTAPNQAPSATITLTSEDGLAVTVAASSSDADGTVVSHRWTFGDGTAAVDGATATHTYANPGTYTITLTVTDDDDATGTATRSVTVTDDPAPVAPLALDAFGRSVTGGLGTADTGGAWSTTGSSTNYSVSGGQANLRLSAAGGSSTGSLNSVSSTNTDTTLNVRLDKVPTGGGAYVSVIGRRVGTSTDYRLQLRYQSNGTVAVNLIRKSNGAETSLTPITTLAGGAVAVGSALEVRLQVEGTSPTQLRAKVWRAGSAEPSAWLLTASDSATALQATGGIGINNYLSGSSTSAPVTVSIDDLRVVDLSAPVANTAPTAAFSTSTDGSTLTVNGGASGDADGSVAQYRWTFGDGSPMVTTATPTTTHTYSEDGTYTVTLVVVDDDGDTSPAASHTVVVSTAAAPVLGADAFGRTVTGGLGTADQGGGWTISSTPSAFAVNAGVARITGTRSANRAAYLTGASAVAMDVRADLALAEAATGGGAYASLIGRRVSNGNDYRTMVRYMSTGQVQVVLIRRVGGGDTTLTSTVLPGVTAAPNQPLRVRMELTGTTTTTFRAKVWAASDAEPAAWTLTNTSATPTVLQSAGHVGLLLYTSGSWTGTGPTLVVDNLVVEPV